MIMVLCQEYKAANLRRQTISSTKSSIMTSIEQKLERLEKKLAFYRLIQIPAMALVIIFVVLSFRPDPAQDVVRAKEFQVVNANGKVSASFTSDDNGAGFIRLYDNAGNNLVSILRSNGGTGAIALKDDLGNFTWRVSYAEGGGGFMGLYNDLGKEIVTLTNTDIGSGFFSVNDKAELPLFKITYATESKSGWVGIYNASGKNVVKLTTDNKGLGSVSVFDNYEQKRAVLGTSTSGDGILSIYNSIQNRVCALGADANGLGRLTVYSSSGAVHSSFP